MTDRLQPSSFDEMTLFYKRFLKLIAVLPFDGHDYTYLVTRMLLAYCLASSMLFCSTLVCYIIYECRTGMPAIDTICEAVLVVGAYSRFCLLLGRRFEFANLLEESRTIWEICDEEDRRSVRHFERKVRLLFQCLFGSCVIVNILYSIAAVSLTLEAARNSNATHTKHFLPYKWFADGVEDYWPGYKVNFAVQVMLIMNGGTISSTVDSAAPFLIMVGAGYFRALQRRLFRTYNNALKNDDNPLLADRELVTCSRFHQRILKYCSGINEITRNLFFVQLVCTGYNTSLIGIKLAGTDPDKYKYAPLVLLNLSQLFICQWAPDHLMEESGAISTAAYSVSCPWMKRRMGKLLVLIIARAQRRVQMTAAGVVNLSLENFGSMLTSALSFFMVLRNLNV